MQASGGYRGVGGSVLVLSVQGASWCYRGAGGSVLVLSVQPASGGY